MARLDHDWFPADLPDGVELGDRSWLYSSFAFIHCRSRRPRPLAVGADSGVYHGTFFDLGTEGEVRVGDFCSIVGATFCTDGAVSIEDHTFIAHEVVVADGPWAQPWTDAATGAEPPPPRTIGPNAWIGARAVLLDGADVGEDAIVGAGAVVSEPVPDGCLAVGNPARIHRRSA